MNHENIATILEGSLIDVSRDASGDASGDDPDCDVHTDHDEGQSNVPNVASFDHSKYRDPEFKGKLKKICKKGVKMRQFYLFDDRIAYGKVLVGDKIIGELKFIPVEGTRVENVDRVKYAFEIKSIAKSFKVVATNDEEKSNWIMKINEVINRHHHNVESTVEVAPTWVQDKEAAQCALCSTLFSFRNRKHHCRKCGHVICGACSPNKKILRSNPSQRVRVCNDCLKDRDIFVDAKDYVEGFEDVNMRVKVCELTEKQLQESRNLLNPVNGDEDRRESNITI